MMAPDGPMPNKDAGLDKDDALTLGWQAVLAAAKVSRAAPLSARQALHAAVLVDQLSDLAYARRARLAEQRLATAGDVLTFRAALRACDPALGQIMDLTACGANSPHLQVVAAAVTPEGFGSLPVADLMVSLYNSGTVPRLMLVQSDGSMLPMQGLLQQVTAWWDATLSA